MVGSFLGYAIGAAMRGGLKLFHIDLNVRLDLGPDWWRRALVLAGRLAGALAAISGVQAVRRRPRAAARTGVAAALAVAFVVLAWNADWFEVHGTLAELLGRNWWTLAVVCMLAPAFKLATIGSGLVGVSLPGFLAPPYHRPAGRASAWPRRWRASGATGIRERLAAAGPCPSATAERRPALET